MRSHWIRAISKSTMICVFIRREKFGHRDDKRGQQEQRLKMDTETVSIILRKAKDC
jgi:hypothetical protein